MFMVNPLPSAGEPFMIRPSARRSLGELGANSTVKVFTYKLGEVTLPCYDRNDGTVDLYATIKGMDANQPDIIVKGIDAAANNLDVENIAYTLPGLARRPTIRVNVAQCKANWALIQSMKGQKPSGADAKKLLAAQVYNSAVDIHFLSCLFIQYLHEKVGINNTTNTNVMFSCSNVPNLDNAFFTGQYMVYGNGATMFDPLGVMDVLGHENTHGVNRLLAANMPYAGHSGALDESGADIGGRMFEGWVYTKYNSNSDPADDIPGQDDWLMGEDVVKNNGFLRNMQDPTKASPPQPATYRGQYWADPNSQADYGGVHTDSGPGNRAFYLLSSSVGIDLAFQIYMQVLRALPALPTYIDYRDTYLTASAKYGKTVEVQAVLTTIGLGPGAVNDWRKQNIPRN